MAPLTEPTCWQQRWYSQPYRERRFRDKAVNGKQLLQKDEFRRHFGHATWEVYCHDLRFRNTCIGREARRFGECWQGAATTAITLKLSRYQVNRARENLQSIGLERGEWCIRRGRMVYVRVVIGNFDLDGKNLRVPQRVIDLLRARKRGGARPGAGRPRKEIKPANPEIKPATDLLPSEEADQETLSLAIASEARTRAEGAHSDPTLAGKEHTMPTSEQSLSELLANGVPSAQNSVTQAQSVLTRMPPPPSIAQINPPVVPQPPDLPENDDADFAILSKAYDNAVQYVGGARPSRFSRRALSPALLEKTLGASGRLLREHRLPPIVWAVWSVRCWQAIQRKDHPRRKRFRAPPVEWVYNPNRIEKHHGWCRSEMGCELGGTVFIPPSALELQRRWREMRSAVIALKDKSPERVGSIVYAWFPDGLYDRLVARAIEEAEKKRQEYAQGMARGAWIWG